jgi:hypothetical protein
VQVEGTVRYVRAEKDGDVHIRLCDGGLCVIAECVSYKPCARPRKGSRVRVSGVSRYDGAPGHGWWEVHPVEGIEVAP